MITNWIYLSPHFDDAVFSCGGLIWEQTHAGDSVMIWTICAGEIPPGSLSPYAKSLHARWGIERQSIENRRQEDISACSLLSASYRHFAIPDSIYRREGEVYSVTRRGEKTEERLHPEGGFLYASDEAIFGSLHPSEQPLVAELADELKSSIPGDARVVCPLTLGGHVDHQLVRAAVETLGWNLWYYADFPYVEKEAQQLKLLIQEGWIKITFPVSSQGLEAWQKSVAAHRSQISSFWSNLESMRRMVQEYLERTEGVILWRPPAIIETNRSQDVH